MHYFSFAKGEWSFDTLPMTYSFATKDFPPVRQERDCISAGYNEKIGDFDYIGVCMTEKVSVGATVSGRCSFLELGAPLLVLADGVRIDENGNRRYTAVHEIVAYQGGCNVWRLLPDFDPNAPEVGYTIKSLTQQHFDVEEDKIVTLTVRTLHGKLDISLDDYRFTVDTPELPESFYVGLILCEGENKFYDLKIEN